MKNETLFNSAEQFHSFRQSWKDFIKDGKHLKVPKETWDGSVYKESNLLCVHHLIYALLRGRDVTQMFVPNNKEVGKLPYFAFHDAKSEILLATSSTVPEHYSYLFEPFNGTVDMDLLRLVVVDLKEISL